VHALCKFGDGQKLAQGGRAARAPGSCVEHPTNRAKLFNTESAFLPLCPIKVSADDVASSLDMATSTKKNNIPETPPAPTLKNEPEAPTLKHKHSGNKPYIITSPNHRTASGNDIVDGFEFLLVDLVFVLQARGLVEGLHHILKALLGGET